MFKTIAWATDMSPSAEAAGVLASDMASAMGARLIVIHVTEVALGHAGAAVNPTRSRSGLRCSEPSRTCGAEASTRSPPPRGTRLGAEPWRNRSSILRAARARRSSSSAPADADPSRACCSAASLCACCTPLPAPSSWYPSAERATDDAPIVRPTRSHSPAPVRTRARADRPVRTIGCYPEAGRPRAYRSRCSSTVSKLPIMGASLDGLP